VAGLPPLSTQIARDIFHYVLSELSDEAGGFYSAEDADSYPTEDSKEKAGSFVPNTRMDVRCPADGMGLPLLHRYMAL